MRDVRQVTVITANPSGRADLGRCEVGFYVVEKGLLTMTDSDGAPLRDTNTGHRIQMHLLPGESEKAAAKKLTLKIWRGARNDEMAGFHRPIRYRDAGVA